MKKPLTIVKIGGKVIDNDPQLHAFLQKLSDLKGNKILVHGGGNIASLWQKKLGIPPRMIEGRRATDAAALEVVTMIYSGVNKKLTACLQALGVPSLGVSGADMNLIRAEKRKVEAIDYGWVGDIRAINTAALDDWIEKRIVPVVCPLTHDMQGHLLNTNADTIASELAKAMSLAHHVTLVYCFEQLGVLSDFESQAVLPKITPRQYSALKAQGTISEGMIPKIDHAFAALAAGVKAVKIGHFDAIDQVHSPSYSGTSLCL